MPININPDYISPGSASDKVVNVINRNIRLLAKSLNDLITEFNNSGKSGFVRGRGTINHVPVFGPTPTRIKDSPLRVIDGTMILDDIDLQINELTASTIIATDADKKLASIADGAANNYLKTDGAGAYTWDDPTTTVPGSDSEIVINDSGAFGTDTSITTDKAGTMTLVGLNITSLTAGSILFIATAQNKLTEVATEGLWSGFA